VKTRWFADYPASSTFYFGTPDGATDLLPELVRSPLASDVATSATRACLDNEQCRQFPKLVGLAATPKNEWGDNLLAEFQYDATGYLATFGGRWDNEQRRFDWSCYAD
jgi:hypothetical protein